MVYLVFRTLVFLFVVRLFKYIVYICLLYFGFSVVSTLFAQSLDSLIYKKKVKGIYEGEVYEEVSSEDYYLALPNLQPKVTPKTYTSKTTEQNRLIVKKVVPKQKKLREDRSLETKRSNKKHKKKKTKKVVKKYAKGKTQNQLISAKNKERNEIYSFYDSYAPSLYSNLPLGLLYKQIIPKYIYKNKIRQPWFISGIGGPYLNPSLGIGLGAPIFFTYNGCDSFYDYSNIKENFNIFKLNKSSEHSCLGEEGTPFFWLSPYQYRVSVVASVFFRHGSLSYQNYRISFDAPYFLGSLFRIQGYVRYNKNTQERYFGYGDASLDTLRSPVDSRSYDDFSDYRDALQEIDDEGNTYALYNSYEITFMPDFYIQASYNIIGLLRLYSGFHVSLIKITDYTGQDIQNDSSATGIQNITKLREDCDADILSGCRDGLYIDDRVRIGISLDWRDFELNPEMGIYLDTSIDISSKKLGSSFSYIRYHLTPKFYFNPFFKLNEQCSNILKACIPARLVFALKGNYTLLEGANVPIYALNLLPGEQANDTGLGGDTHLRGFQANRFIGKSLIYLSLEARWFFVKFNDAVLLAVTPLVDIGRVFDSHTDFEFSKLLRLKLSYGARFDFVWNEGTVFYLQYVVSKEGGNFYFNTGYVF